MLYYFAPLEGITNHLYHEVHRSLFPQLDRYITPFFVPGVTGLSTKDRTHLSKSLASGLPLTPQLLTNRSDDLIRSAEQLKDLGFSELNLNLGCPSGTVFSKGRGAGALRDLNVLQSFLDNIFARSPLPISLKTRIGVADPREWESLLPLFNQYSIHELIIHPRVREEHYRGKPHPEALVMALSESRAPVVYSGDLFSASQVESFAASYPQAKGIMLGRGLIANPALHAMVSEHAPLTQSQMLAFHDLLFSRYRDVLSGEKPVLHKMKELWHYMICLFPDHDKHAKRIRKAQKLSDYEAAVSSLFRDLTLDATLAYLPPHQRESFSKI